jgi:hypothetical protein
MRAGAVFAGYLKKELKLLADAQQREQSRAFDLDRVTPLDRRQGATTFHAAPELPQPSKKVA